MPLVCPARQLHAEQTVHKLHTHPECGSFHSGHSALGTERYNYPPNFHSLVPKLPPTCSRARRRTGNTAMHTALYKEAGVLSWSSPPPHSPTQVRSSSTIHCHCLLHLPHLVSHFHWAVWSKYVPSYVAHSFSPCSSSASFLSKLLAHSKWARVRCWFLLV